MTDQTQLLLHSVDVPGRTIVAIAERLDDYTEAKGLCERWSSGPRPVREMGGKSIGEVVALTSIDARKAIEVSARIDDPTVLLKLTEGLYSTIVISVTGECSLSDLPPSSPDATFKLIHSDGASEMHKLGASRGRTSASQDGDDEAVVLKALKLAQSTLLDRDATITKLNDLIKKQQSVIEAQSTELANAREEIAKRNHDLETIAAEVQKIKDAPLPAAAAIRARPMTMEELDAREQERLNKLSPEERQVELMKLALRRPYQK